MKNIHKSIIFLGFAAMFVTIPQRSLAKKWTLQDCIQYALQNNITLKKSSIKRMEVHEDLRQSQAALLPSLVASTSQNVTYNPWPESGRYMIAGDKLQSSINKVFYNGGYSVSGNMTVWNGGRNTNQIKLNKIAEQQAALDSASTANNIEEQIAQLFVQIMYSQDAIEVFRQTLQTSVKNEERGKEFVKVGNMSKADLAQLTAQRAKDAYALVQAESSVKDYKRQLKRLLQITNDEEFDIVAPVTTAEMALAPIPSVTDVYNMALSVRPEIRSALLGLKSSDLQIKMAKAQRLPTVMANAGFGSNTTSMNNNSWGSQMKNNLHINGGVSLSVPIYDNRQTRTAVNKARLARQSYELDLQDKQTALYSSIENYWLQAVNNQAQFKSAQVSTQSAQASYELLSQQFDNQLKNVIELMNGKDALLRAQQAELQAKYLAILNIDLLRFYQTGVIK